MKKIISLILAAVMMMTTFAACGSEPESAETVPAETAAAESAAPGETEVQLYDGGVTNATGYPITNEPIELEVAIAYAAHKGNWENYSFWKEIEDKTNIRIKLRILNDQEQAGLMFASQDYPDLAFRTGVNEVLKNDAIAAGDILMLDDLIHDFAPNWENFFNENPDMRKQAAHSDGHIYAFPYVNVAEWDYNLRDCWFINSDWLEELGMEKPTTLDEFTEYLRAVRDNRGKGSIPENAIPYYFRHNEGIGGQQDLYGCFGMFCGLWSPFVKDGVVMHNADNPALKDAVKYLNMLYEEQLIPPEIFTDDWGTYVAKFNAEPAIVGSTTAYGTSLPHWDFLAPLKVSDDITPYIRPQTRNLNANGMMIFKDCKYPVAAARLADMLAEPEWTYRNLYGVKGKVWDMKDGEFVLSDTMTIDDLEESEGCVGNYITTLMTEEMSLAANKAYIEDPTRREWAYYNIYKDYLPDNMQKLPKIPAAFYEEGESDKLAQIQTDVNDYIKTKTAEWITGKSDVDADWDSYVKQLETLGLKEDLAIRQTAYDKFMGK